MDITLSGATGATGTAGAVWRTGLGARANTLGVDGDYYLNNSNGAVYSKTLDSYLVVANITGATGAAGAAGVAGANGSVWRNGSGVPLNTLGINGDYYLDNLTGFVYAKAAGTYSSVANLAGATGPAVTALIDSWTQINGAGQRVPRPNGTTADYASVNIGQLKAVGQSP